MILFSKVQQLRSKVLAMEDIYMSQPIVELMGSYMLSNQIEVAKSEIFKRYVDFYFVHIFIASSATAMLQCNIFCFVRPYPHMFFYNGFDGLEVVVDSRMIGNVARYLRRSCCPNSEVS